MKILCAIAQSEIVQPVRGLFDCTYEITLSVKFRKLGKQSAEQSRYQQRIEELVRAAIADRALDVRPLKPRRKGTLCT